MPTLFSNFPKINYTFKYLDKNDNPVVIEKEITNIHVKFKFSESTLSKSGVAYPFQYRDHDRPDALAEKYYGSSDLYWLVLYSDNRFDVFNEFSKNESAFLDYLVKKYENQARIFAYLSSFYYTAPTSIKLYLENQYSINQILFWQIETSYRNLEDSEFVDFSEFTLFKTVLNDILQNSETIISNNRVDLTESLILSQEYRSLCELALMFLDKLTMVGESLNNLKIIPEAFKIENNKMFVDSKLIFLKNLDEYETTYSVTKEQILSYCGSQIHSFYDIDGYEIDPYNYVENFSNISNGNLVKTIYEFEEEENSKKRNTKLVDLRYSKQIREEFEDLLTSIRKDFE